jgi:hypothetical protein
MLEPFSDRESFENSYHYFVVALKSLAASADEQGETYGSFDDGAAWELKHDVSAGMQLFNCTSCSLSTLQREKLSELVRQLNTVPADVGFRHPSWVALRQLADELLSLLEPVTRANAAYFRGPGK